MRQQIFIKCLNMGNKWEKKLTPIIERFIYTVKIKLANYNKPEERDIQLIGIDGIASQIKQSWESKTRSYKYYLQGILLETVSIEQTNKPGWVYTSEADIISYCWETENGQNLMPNGYIILIKELRKTDWFKKINNYPYIRASTENRWTTANRLIPIDDFPIGTLYEFNPTIPNTNYKQMKLALIQKSKLDFWQ